MSYVHHVLHLISISFERASRMRQVHEWHKSKRITNQLTYSVSMGHKYFCYLYISFVCFTCARMDEIYLLQLSPPTVVKVARVCQFPKKGEFTRQQL